MDTNLHRSGEMGVAGYISKALFQYKNRLSRYGDSHVKDNNMGIHYIWVYTILVRRQIYIETTPWTSIEYKDSTSKYISILKIRLSGYRLVVIKRIYILVRRYFALKHPPDFLKLECVLFFSWWNRFSGSDLWTQYEPVCGNRCHQSTKPETVLWSTSLPDDPLHSSCQGSVCLLCELSNETCRNVDIWNESIRSPNCENV